MAHFKIYGRAAFVRAAHAQIGDLVHAAAVRTLRLPQEKRFHRFFPLEGWQLDAPPDRSEHYLLIEALMFSGRSTATKKALVRALMDDLTRELDLAPIDVEITIIEAPRENWGIRGQHGDELELPYDVEV